MKTTTFFVVFALLALGCGRGSRYTAQKAKKITPVQFHAGDEAKLLPLKVGNQWVYTLIVGQQQTEVTLRVSNVTRTGGRTNATIESTVRGSKTEESEWVIDSNGIFQSAARKDARYDPPQPIVPFPVEMDREKTVTTVGPLTSGGTGKQSVTVEYLGPQEVDTDMGRMSALAMKSTTTWTADGNSDSMHSIAWWVPGIGFVRQRQEITTARGTGVVLMKLKSYSFP
ncbi:MAG TPA: hypothetical protein VNI20_14235 [Fimbriimonadaceae bacterium]|nr:hypothetical protein [Fimbriimonadaceae bacterium]